MAIVNPTGTYTGGLLRQILAERDQVRNSGSPNSQPGSATRDLIQGPELQAESIGSGRIASVKPLLNTQNEALPPQANVLPGGIPSMPTTPGNVIGPAAHINATPSTAAAAPATATPPSSAPAATMAPNPNVAKSSGAKPVGQVLGASTSNNYLPFSPSSWYSPGATRIGGTRKQVIQPNLVPRGGAIA